MSTPPVPIHVTAIFRFYDLNSISIIYKRRNSANAEGLHHLIEIENIAFEKAWNAIGNEL